MIIELPEHAQAQERILHYLEEHQVSMSERYFSAVDHTDTTDYLIEGAVKALLVNGERVINNPRDYDARAEIQWLDDADLMKK